MSQRTMDFANWMLKMKNVHYHDVNAMSRAFEILEEVEENNKTK